MKALLINPPISETIASIMPKVLEEGMDFLPPLGLMYVAAYAAKHTAHEIKILDCPVEKIDYQKLAEILKAEKPDVIGITAMTFTLLDVLKAARLAKETVPGVKIALGGPHVNIFPEETLANAEVDYLVLGEGEQPFADLLDNIEDSEKLKGIKGLAFRHGGGIVNTGPRELMNDLDLMPFPAREMTPYKKYYSLVARNNPTTTMFTSRGCPYQCLFCDRPHLGKVFRARSAENVAAELREIESLGIKEVFIYDDTFTIDRQRVVDICNLILSGNIKLSWDVRARVNTVDAELLALMKKAGCTRIHYGVEAGTEKILKVLNKNISIPQVRRVFAETKKAGIETAGYFMIGSPTETMEDIKETIKLARELSPDYAQFSILTPFPATNLYLKGLSEGVIKTDYWREFARHPRAGFQPPAWEENFTHAQLLKILVDAYKTYYLSPRYIIRRLKQLRSWDELKNNVKAGLKMISLALMDTDKNAP